MAFFIRLLFPALLFLSASLSAQNDRLNSTSDLIVLSRSFTASNAVGSIVVFKRPLQLADLPMHYKWGIADAKGNILVQPLWDSIGHVGHDLAEVFQYIPQRKKAALKAGLISLQQKTLLPLQYRSVQWLTGSYYTLDTGKGFQLWQSSKGVLSPVLYDSIISTPSHLLLYTEGFCHRLDSTAQKVMRGPFKSWHTNDKGKVYPISYDTLYLYRNGATALVPVAADSVLASSKTDEILLYRNAHPIPYRFIALTAHTLAEDDDIHPSSLSTLLDSTLIKIKTRSKADSIVLVNNWYLYRRNNMWGYGDTLGNIGIGAQYEELRYKHNNRFAMKYKGKWGFLDNYENIIVQPYYDEVGDFHYSGTWVRQGKKYNFVGLNGKLLNSNWYDHITLTAGKNYLVQLKGKTGLVSKEGREIIGTRYLQVLDFGEGSCLVQTEDGKWFLMNYSEYRISNDPYSSVQYFSKSKVYVLKK